MLALLESHVLNQVLNDGRFFFPMLFPKRMEQIKVSLQLDVQRFFDLAMHLVEEIQVQLVGADFKVGY